MKILKIALSILHPLTLLAIIGTFCLTPIPAQANGVGWNFGAGGGAPGPEKQSALVLKKEKVVFDPKMVTARFWVYNPSDVFIATPMGFPVDYNDLNRDFPAENYAKEFSSSVKVQVDGKLVPFQTELPKAGEYPIVIRWEMAFAPSTITEFTVVYPMDAPYEAADGLGDNMQFIYITHTGAYWAKPIEEATFELHSRKFVDLMTNFPPGSYWDGGTQIYLNWSVQPSPTRIDRDAGTVIWERHNWTPQKGRDDIQIDAGFSFGANPPCVDGCGPFGGSFEDLCGRTFEGDSGDSQLQFGAFVQIDRQVINQDNFLEIVRKADTFPYGERGDANFDELPSPHQMSYELSVLRYLRNYLFAIHGHKFKDEELAECFADVAVTEKPISAVEKRNIDFILSTEKELRPREQAAWVKIRSRQIPRNVYSNLTDF